MRLSRRIALLGSVSVFAVHMIGDAKAWTHGNPFSVNDLSQLNFNFLLTGGEYPFLNCMKTAQQWQLGSGGSAVTPTALDTNGYPTNAGLAALGTSLNCLFNIPSQASRPGNYVVVSTGTGTISATVAGGGSLSSTAVSGTNTQTAFTVQPVGQAVTFSITATDVVTPITSLAVVHSSDVASYLAGGVWGVQFLARLNAGKFGVFRFLNWLGSVGVNTSGVSLWAYRKPLNYVFYHGFEMRASLFATSGALSGNDYPITLGSGGPTDKQTVHVKWPSTSPSGTAPTTVTITASIGNPLVINWTAHPFTSSNDSVGLATTGVLPTPLLASGSYFFKTTGNANQFNISLTPGGAAINATSATQSGVHTSMWQPTLNLNASGPVAIRNVYGSMISSDGVNERPTSGSIATLVYDADLGWIKRGGDAVTFSQGIDSGMPPELMVSLCTLQNAHPWFCIPYLAADQTTGYTPGTDYATSLATYCLANGPSWMVPRYEVANEVWNSNSNFYATVYGGNKAEIESAGAAGLNSWVSRASSIVGKAISAVYSANRNKYWMIVGVQGSGGDPDPFLRLTGGAFASAPYNIDPAWMWVNYVCTNTYIGSGATVTQELDIAYRYSLAPTDALLNEYADYYSTTVAAKLAQYQSWKAFAVGASDAWISSPKGLTAYEGGWSPDFPTSNTTGSITAATSANPCVLTITGNLPPVGMGLTISGATPGGFNTTNATITNVAGSQVTIAFDASALSAFSGTATATYVNSMALRTVLRNASKNASHMGSITTINYTNFKLAGGYNPSQFELGGSVINGTATADAWSIFYPDVYAADNAYWLSGIISWNANLPRSA